MCTAINTPRFFGRNLDWTEDFGEEPFARDGIVGMAKVVKGYPLFFEGINQSGLGVAGLNFAGNAHYNEKRSDKTNVPSFELIPFLLKSCGTIREARTLLSYVNITKDAFSNELPPSPLHFLVADENESITVEPTTEGLKIYDNPVGVLTNNPEFPYHLTRLCDFSGVTAEPPSNRFSKRLSLTPYSFGMGVIGLPGDLSSSSRFVRACFFKENSTEDTPSQFAHLLSSVEQIKGAVRSDKGNEYTIYSSFFDRKEKLYYYKRYEWNGYEKVSMK